MELGLTLLVLQFFGTEGFARRSYLYGPDNTYFQPPEPCPGEGWWHAEEVTHSSFACSVKQDRKQQAESPRDLCHAGYDPRETFITWNSPGLRKPEEDIPSTEKTFLHRTGGPSIRVPSFLSREPSTQAAPRSRKNTAAWPAFAEAMQRHRRKRPLEALGPSGSSSPLPDFVGRVTKFVIGAAKGRDKRSEEELACHRQLRCVGPH